MLEAKKVECVTCDVGTEFSILPDKFHVAKGRLRGSERAVIVLE